MKKILYITSRLPALSVTFIDREIRALAEAGYDIRTASRGTTQKGEVSEETLSYYRNTLYIDQAGLSGLFFSQLHVLANAPLAWFGNILLIFREKEVKGLKDRLRLLKHLLEAGYVYRRYRDAGLAHIHAHFLNAPTSIALFLSRYLDIPFSFTLHASNIFIDPLMLGTKLRLSKKIVSISEYNRKYVLNRYGNDLACKIHIIHCGIDCEVYQPTRNPKIGIPIVLAVARLVAMKGFAYLLEACRLLKNRGLSFKCLIVGDGEERGSLFAKTTELGVGDVVTFLGSLQQQNVHELLKDASIFVLPAIITDQGHRDGIPVSIMEAMALELPVVSTNIVGIPELVENGKEGLLIEQKNAEALASALEFLIINIPIREEMGKRARAKIVREFNIADVPAKFDAIFN